MSTLMSAAVPAGAWSDVSTPAGNSNKVEASAKQFEALLIGQMLKSARESGSGSALGDDDDSSGQTMLDLADQQFSQVLANNGGLGMARLLVQGLTGPWKEKEAKLQIDDNSQIALPRPPGVSEARGASIDPAD